MKRMPATSGWSRAEHRLGLRPLQRQQPALERLDLAGGAEPGLEVREVVGLAGGVDDEEQVVAAVRDHQVVEDAAGVVGEEARSAAAPARGRARRSGISRSSAAAASARSPERGRSATWPMWLTSKRPAAARVCRCSFRMPVGYCTGIVVAGEGDHPGAQRHVQGVERRLQHLGHTRLLIAARRKFRERAMGPQARGSWSTLAGGKTQRRGHSGAGTHMSAPRHAPPGGGVARPRAGTVAR